MATPPPAKLKAHLGQFKEIFIDSDSNDAERMYLAVLSMELVQRCVLLTSTDDDVKVLESVQSTAGRPLLDLNSSIPKPLLAAASAMAGMVAEKCALGTFRDNDDLSSTSAWTRALSRCSEVNDDRFKCLLQLMTATSRKKLLLHVAEGYFLRAASFQPDPPQMWKKALDVIEQRQGDASTLPFEAALPLSHLIRIAESKGNAKRVSELSLRLAECYLSPPQDTHEKVAIAAFVALYRTAEKSYSAMDCAKQALEALKRCNVELLQDTDLLRHKLLSLRVQRTLESAQIDRVSHEKQTAAKNRGSSMSIETFHDAARSEVLIESLQYPTLDVAANDLRDHILLSFPLESNVQDRQRDDAMELLVQHVKRLTDRAKAVSVATKAKKSVCTKQDAELGLAGLVNFVVPVLNRVELVSEWNPNTSVEECTERVKNLFTSISLASLHMVESCLLAASSWMWMTCGQKHDTSLISSSLLELIEVALSVSLEIASRQDDERRRALLGSDVVMATSDVDTRILELECANASVLALVALAHVNETDHQSGWRFQRANEQAIHMVEKRDTYVSLYGQFGTPYLQFALVWSGMYQSAWPLCNATQARRIVQSARETLTFSLKEWGRDFSLVENMLLDISEADAESGLLNGGFGRVASQLYNQVLAEINLNERIDRATAALMRSHCLNGLARVAFYDDKPIVEQDGNERDPVEAMARQALIEAINARSGDFASQSPYLWNSKAALDASISYHINAARQWVADSLVRANRPEDAQIFLEEAVRDAPLNFDAACALGAFRMRMVFYREEKGARSADDEKAAQMQLLKAAKLDSTRADPFALLGVWYEERNDIQRALGCYAKALQLEPPNPVAGRGMLRLKSLQHAQSICETATNSNSSCNGWAWRALGQQKSMIEGNDELAIVCFHKALRCRDIDCPGSESLSVFFKAPSGLGSFSSERAGVWTEVAGCYRRLGRYSAAVRAFEAAWQASDEQLPSLAVCSWAQVELEVGLFEDAVDKFNLVLKRGDAVRKVAAYGQGSALLAITKRDAQDGKYGAAFEHLKCAIDGINETFLPENVDYPESTFVCALKLLGDLYSFAAMLPPDLFSDRIDDTDRNAQENLGVLASQLSFVALGEHAYKAAESATLASSDDEDFPLQASIICDIGANILLQAQLLSGMHGEGAGTSHGLPLRGVSTNAAEERKLFSRSAESFQRAIEMNPNFGPAWCGLGCAVCGLDPLLAQHAFCTSVQLDRTQASSWANLGFLYASHDALAASGEMMDALTQVADSPLMWICRAALLEREAYQSDSGHPSTEALISRAADAYRAALQVVKDPSALLGLALTARMGTSDLVERLPGAAVTKLSIEKSRKESQGCMVEYSGLTGACDIGASILGDVMSMEDGLYKHISGSHGCIENVVQCLERLPLTVDERNLSSVDGIDIRTILSLSKYSSGSCSSLSSDDADQTRRVESNLFPNDQSLSRKIVHDPENGQLWLDLAKAMAKDLISVMGSNKRKLVRQTLESAIRAADHAAMLLSRHSSHPLLLRPPMHTQNGNTELAVGHLAPPSHGAVPNIVQARDVSEALALTYWLRKIEVENQNKSDVMCCQALSFDVQRALFMNPENALARQVMVVASGEGV